MHVEIELYSVDSSLYFSKLGYNRVMVILPGLVGHLKEEQEAQPCAVYVAIWLLYTYAIYSHENLNGVLSQENILYSEFRAPFWGTTPIDVY